MMNLQSSEYSVSSSSYLSSMSFCWENSCSKSDQEKDHSQSQNSSVSQEHAQSYNKKEEHLKAHILN